MVVYLQETHAGLRTLCRGIDEANQASDGGGAGGGGGDGDGGGGDGGGGGDKEPLFMRVFSAVDTDGNGTIDRKELKRAFEALDIPAR